jgi:hypothetical protein
VPVLALRRELEKPVRVIGIVADKEIVDVDRRVLLG